MVKQFKNVPGRMTGGKYNCISFKTVAICCNYRCYRIVSNNKVCYLLFKQEHTTACFYLCTHSGYNLRQFVSANMRVRLVKDLLFCPKLRKYMQYLVDAATL